MTVDKNAEKVLCIKRDDLPPRWVENVAAVKMTEEAFLGVLADLPFHWLSRARAETDFDYKQLIPYVLVQTADGLHTGCYRRKGAERRLYDFWSVGAGGHINPCDCQNGNGSLSAMIHQGRRREMAEEFRSLPGDPDTVFHGVINEEKTPVGHVHLGLVYRIHLWEREGFQPGKELDSFMWIETEKVFFKQLELWSRLALNLLDSEWE